MADSLVETRPTNGVSYGYTHLITSDDAANNAIVFDFQCNMDLVANVQVVDANDNAVSLDGLELTFPAAGQVRVADGGVFSLVEGHTLFLIANRKRPFIS